MLSRGIAGSYGSVRASQAVLVVKNLLANAEDTRDWGSIPESGKSHSSLLAWRIPWAKEPGRLQSIGSQRVGHD